MRKLNPKQMAFVREYLVDSNATQAAIRAGYSKKTAGQQAHELLKNIEIQSRLKQKQAKIDEKVGLTAEKIAQEIANLAHSDIAEIMHSDGRVKMPHELSPATRAAVASFEINQYGEIKYKFWDKNTALTNAAKIRGMFEKDNEQQKALPVIGEIRLTGLTSKKGA